MKPIRNFILSPFKSKIIYYGSLISLFIAIIFFISPENQTHQNTTPTIKKQIDQLTKSDRKILQETFSQLVLWSSFGHTLFGDKPISFELRPSLENFWIVWKKNEQLFPVKNYIFTHFKYHDYFGVLIGNKRVLKTVIEENEGSFQRVFDSAITSSLIIEALENGSGKIFDTLFSHDALLGILLGYGKENAWNFYERQIRTKEGKLDQLPFLNSKLQAFHKPLLFWEVYVKKSKSLLPQFAADLSSQETKDLKKKYQIQNNHIEKRYRGEDSLRVTLQQLCQE